MDALNVKASHFPLPPTIYPLRTILKSVHHSNKLGVQAARLINNFILVFVCLVVKRTPKRKTITAYTVKRGVQCVLKKELQRHAIALALGTLPGKVSHYYNGLPIPTDKIQVAGQKYRADLLKILKHIHPQAKVESSAPLFLAVVLEYVVTELLELAGNAARDNKKTIITPWLVASACFNDEELAVLVNTLMK